MQGAVVFVPVLSFIIHRLPLTLTLSPACGERGRRSLPRGPFPRHDGDKVRDRADEGRCFSITLLFHHYSSRLQSRIRL